MMSSLMDLLRMARSKSAVAPRLVEGGEVGRGGEVGEGGRGGKGVGGVEEEGRDGRWQEGEGKVRWNEG